MSTSVKCFTFAWAAGKPAMMVGEVGKCLGWVDAKIKIHGGDTFHVPHTVFGLSQRIVSNRDKLFMSHF